MNNLYLIIEKKNVDIDQKLKKNLTCHLKSNNQILHTYII